MTSSSKPDATPSLPADLAARRSLLRQAQSLDDYQLALRGASEEDRNALTKTFPPTRLINAEGGSPRACFALTALGKPALVAETLSKTKADYLAAALVAARDRTADWIFAFCDELAEVSGWQDGRPLELALQLQIATGLTARAPRYVERMPYFLSSQVERDAKPEQGGAQIVEALQRHQGLPMQAFWCFFEVEGLGSNYQLTQYQSQVWDAAIVQLAQADKDFRERALDTSLDALLRDFSAKNIVWYLQVQRLLRPDVQETAARQSRYLAVLSTQPSTAVGLAQDMLAELTTAAALDVDALIEASASVLLRTEKKLLKAQLKLLAEIQTSCDQRQRISQIVADALPSMPADVAVQAQKLVLSDSKPILKASTTSAEASANAEPLPIIAPPRNTALAGARTEPAPIQSEEEWLTLFAQLLENLDYGPQLPRMFAYLALHPKLSLPPQLQQRAQEIRADLWDEAHASPRRLLPAAMLNLDETGFKGYRRYVVGGRGRPDIPGVEYQNSTGTSSSYDSESDSWKVTETFQTRSGYQYLPTHAATALLADVFKNLQQSHEQAGAFEPPQPLPYQQRIWQKEIKQPDEGCFSRDLEVLGNGPKPFWNTTAPPAETSASLHQRALDVSQIAQEFTFRAQEAREQDGYEAIVHWAAWLLRDNLDTLAAQMHPVLCAAVQVINVRGLPPLLKALGGARQPPAAPVYSALALAASAKMAEHRAQTAEAIASLTGSNLLHPTALATEISAHLTDGFALAGRIAQTLADAASISALAGLRVLQTLEALLPHLLDKDGKPLTQASKLIELVAKLAVDYGLPLSIPEALAARSKGSSALAVALRTLAGIKPAGTPLIQEAATQANAQAAP